MAMFSLPKIFRAAAVAVALGGTALVSMPAQAQPTVEFRFGGPGFSWEFNNGPRRRSCMTDPQVRRDLRRDGYRNIRFFDRRGRIVQVTARLGRRAYEIEYDKCRGRIVDRDRIWRR